MCLSILDMYKSFPDIFSELIPPTGYKDYNYDFHMLIISVFKKYHNAIFIYFVLYVLCLVFFIQARTNITQNNINLM